MSVCQLKKIDATLPVRFATGQKTASGKISYKSRVRIGRFYPQVIHASGENAVANDNSASGRTIHTDHLGTPVKMTDNEQKVVWERVAEPFGETLNITGPATLNLRFAGQYYDSESGLLYNLMRSIDPRNGRGTQSDPIGLLGGINTYAYVGNNPIRFIDPLGLFGNTPPGNTPPGANPSLCSQYSCECATADCAAGLPFAPQPPQQPLNPAQEECEGAGAIGCKLLPFIPEIGGPLFYACEIGTTVGCIPLFANPPQNNTSGTGQSCSANDSSSQNNSAPSSPLPQGVPPPQNIPLPQSRPQGVP